MCPSPRRCAASREIIEGKHDDIPESAFLFAGGIDDVLRKAGK